MGTPLFIIISSDLVISRRWQKAFQKEGWEVGVHLSCPPDKDNPCNRQSELLLLEVGTTECNEPQELRTILKMRHPVSTLVFCDQQKIHNRQIAAFLEAGADDFIYKGIDERVLVAKLKAHIRRIMPAIQEAAVRVESSSGGIAIDGNLRAVKIELKSGKYSELSNLTSKEFEILSMLVSNEKRVISREAMLEKLWGDEAVNVYSECVDKHIESLRKKLGQYGKKIKTIYGAGYMFTEKSEG